MSHSRDLAYSHAEVHKKVGATLAALWGPEVRDDSQNQSMNVGVMDCHEALCARAGGTTPHGIVQTDATNWALDGFVADAARAAAAADLQDARPSTALIEQRKAAAAARASSLAFQHVCNAS